MHWWPCHRGIWIPFLQDVKVKTITDTKLCRGVCAYVCMSLLIGWIILFDLTKMTRKLQIECQSVLLCCISCMSLQYLKSGFYHHWLTLTIISLSCDTEATKAVTPSCEHMAEMNRLESAMWWANAQLAVTERGNISWFTTLWVTMHSGTYPICMATCREPNDHQTHVKKN